MLSSFKTLKKNRLVTTCTPTNHYAVLIFYVQDKKIKPIKNKNNHFSDLSFSCIGVNHQNHFG